MRNLGNLIFRPFELELPNLSPEITGVEIFQISLDFDVEPYAGKRQRHDEFRTRRFRPVRCCRAQSTLLGGDV